jgi:hypothetical protein
MVDKNFLVSPDNTNKIIDETFKIDPNELKAIQDRALQADQPYYQEQKNYLNQDYTQAKDEINRMIGYTNTDYVNQLADQNKAFSRSLNKATNVY